MPLSRTTKHFQTRFEWNLTRGKIIGWKLAGHVGKRVEFTRECCQLVRQVRHRTPSFIRLHLSLLRTSFPIPNTFALCMTLDAPPDAIDTCQFKETDFIQLLINVAHANRGAPTESSRVARLKIKREKMLLIAGDGERSVWDRPNSNLFAPTRLTGSSLSKSWPNRCRFKAKTSSSFRHQPSFPDNRG